MADNKGKKTKLGSVEWKRMLLSTHQNVHMKGRDWTENFKITVLMA